MFYTEVVSLSFFTQGLSRNIQYNDPEIKNVICTLSGKAIFRPLKSTQKVIIRSWLSSSKLLVMIIKNNVCERFRKFEEIYTKKSIV